MPMNDLLNASQYLDAPTSQEQAPVDTESKVDALNKYSESLISNLVNEIDVEDAARDMLPDTLQFAGLDTGIPISQKTAAFLVGMGDGLTDTWDGVQQMVGSEATKRELQAEQNLMTDLYNDPRFGSAARVGQFTGFMVDPIGVLVPAARGKKLWDVAKIGAATGTAFAGLGYVDEEQGQTRAGNALVGMVTGGVFSPTLFAAARGVKGVGAKIQEKSAEHLLRTYNRQWNQFVKNGANPVQATEMAMKRMQWTIPDKARLLATAGKDMSIDIGAFYDPTKSKTRNELLRKELAQRNLDEMQSRPALAWNKLLDKSPALREVWEGTKSIGRGASKFITPVATRLNDLDPVIAKHLMKMEARTHKVQSDLHRKHATFVKKLRDIEESGTPEGRAMTRALLDGDFDEARQIWAKTAGKDSLGLLETAIEDQRMLGKGLQGEGYDIPLSENYWARRVTDYDGLAKFQGSQFTEALRSFKNLKRRNPTDRELTAMLRKIKNPKDPVRAKTGAGLKQRQIKDVTEEHLPYYAKAYHSFLSGMNDAVTDIERARFFKANGYKPKQGFATDGSDLEGVLEGLLKSGRMKGKYANGDVEQIIDLLKSRFGKGEIAPSQGVQMFKNMSYIATLGNVKSAITQFGDLAWSAHKNGILNTTAAWFRGLPGLRGKGSKLYIDKEAMLGLEDAMQEFAENTNLKRALDKVLTVTGFKGMDRLGKETFVNAHYRQVHKALNDPKRAAAERMRLRREWQDVYGGETDLLIRDLEKGIFTDRMQVYMFNQLAEVQPIALASMPQPYLNHPNGRMLYMLRSFTIKQLDLMRNDIIKKIADGDYKGGAYNFMSLASLFTLANGTADMVKDFMTGKEIEMEDTLVDNIWKLMGMNRYTGDRVLGGTPGQAVIDMVAPPLSVYDRVLNIDSTAKAWEASPFNGLQIFDKMLNNGELTRDPADAFDAGMGAFHDTMDK